MEKRFTISDVKKIIESKSNCKLISNEYKNAQSIIELECECGEVFSTRFFNFQYNNVRCCKKCILEAKKKNGEIVDLESASQFIKEKSNGKCTLISSVFKNCKSKLDIKCSCGNIFQSTISNFKMKSTLGCIECYHNTLRLNKSDIVKTAEKFGCKILDIDCYKNTDSKITFECKCGEKFITTFEIFKSGHKLCPKCVNEMVAKNQRTDFSEIKNKIKGTECQLISEADEYKNQYSHLRFKCSCGRVFKRSFVNYMRLDKRCAECSSSKGEREIARILDKLSFMDITYKKEFSFYNLLSERGYPLRFDFALFFKDSFLGLIEYDGEFHYQAIINEELYLKQQRSDKKKNEFCEKNNISLLRIPYYEYENIPFILKDFLLQINTEVKHDSKVMAHRRA